MKKLKLSAITKRRLKTHDIRPVDVEDYTEETLNQDYPVEILGSKYRRGTVIRQIDEVQFRYCCRDTERANVDDGLWMEVRGDFYDVDTVIQKLTDAGFEIENDLKWSRYGKR